MASYPHYFLISFLLLAIAPLTSSFQVNRPSAKQVISAPWRASAKESRYSLHIVAATKDDGSSDNKMSSDVEEYRNAPTAFLANFMQSDNEDTKVDPLADIDFDAPKSPNLGLEVLAAVLDAELYDKEWFVTGRVNPIYFDDKFQFQDPDVKLTGVEEYARGVLKLFSADSRAQIISCVVNTTISNTITITWRLSGRVNIGPKGLPIKPYICYTDFTVDEESGLVAFQEDKFDIPGWDILLSALFPFLIGKVTSEPAPEVEPRVVEMPVISGGKKGGIFGGLFQQLGL
mmetsp:Transcript_30931/g.56053  ORF Transcript_30931/g.56053 Transcript_30931/m.56053 type:complete len:288 (+) Transcript_30931:65-928(+)|eukprot:CAMPEP_0201882152 /NCGR_PEP_ID=MMETSP0902-20130614/13377_1 /ASSEMBLY_ACC=CAM_ASM_000551 /TAXON_ID=420261 /ORGANISM="Thalassiosira antarctica, Strain CCMP982" /LENGTH=287 /DNA_ID=CAMNT_0048410563 /DNA_START=37 /DNA_END=900 /DNA_ORIENTATION=+